MTAFASACYEHGRWCGGDRFTAWWVITAVTVILAGGLVTDLAAKARKRPGRPRSR